jgi:HKD family nuclease
MGDIIVGGLESTSSLETKLQSLFTKKQPSALGMATAFLSLAGAQKFDSLVMNSGATAIRVVIGISGAVTHPSAIKFLAEKNYSVRLGNHSPGIFHPKLLVGGDRFIASGKLRTASCGYIGSANFTDSGLTKNIEVALTTIDPALAQSVGDAFSAIWTVSGNLTNRSLDQYEKVFSKRLGNRTIEDLRLLNVLEGTTRRGRSLPPEPLIIPQLCNGVWTGLQSFTGEHTFQVEFPRKAGEALGVLLGARDRPIEVECADGILRTMTFRYYQDNGMYRLNVPNDLPLVDWVRRERRGALLVWKDSHGENEPIQARILRGRSLLEISEKSRALGTWGRTPTREYGWY